MKIRVDIGVKSDSRVILVGEYLDRCPDALVEALATSANTAVSRIRFWLQTNQMIDLDGEGKRIADFALANGHINQAQYDVVMA